MLLLYSLNSIPPNDFSNSLDQRYHAHLVVRCEHNLVVKCDKPVGRVDRGEVEGERPDPRFVAATIKLSPH